MTGKEALEKIKNNQHYREEKNWIIATSLQNTEEYKAINKDLEVLEIIRMKYVDVDVVRICLKRYEDIDTALWYYNFLACREDRILTLEELLKLKQWLEENE